MDELQSSSREYPHTLSVPHPPVAWFTHEGECLRWRKGRVQMVIPETSPGRDGVSVVAGGGHPGHTYPPCNSMYFLLGGGRK